MTTFSFGYIPDIGDFRDLTIKTVDEQVLPKSLDVNNSDLPRLIDNKKWVSNIEDQSKLGACVAHGCTSIFEYMEKKSSGKYVDGSRLFTYWNARKYGNFDTNQDTGAYVRSGIKSIVMNGICEESLFPYNIARFKEQPSQFLYSNAQQFKAVKYMRLDDGTPNLIQRMKNVVASGLPIVFGFTVFESLYDVSRQVPVVPFPSRDEKIVGGHCVYIVGYDDDAPSRNSRDGNETTGGFLFANSWSTSWGNGGYAYIPYQFFEQGIAMDCWTISSIDWIDSKQFE